MMLTAFKIKVFFHNDETLDLRLAEIDYPLKKCDTREILFYHIAALAPYFDDLDSEKEYCEIHSNDSQFIAPFTVQQVQDKLEQHLYNCLFFLKN